MNLYLGHDDFADLQGHEGEGVDFLLTEHDDGTRELAVRPGKNSRWHRWGPPATLLPEPAEVFDERMPEDRRG